MHKKVIVKFFHLKKHKKSDQGVDATLSLIRHKMDAEENIEREVDAGVYVQVDKLKKEKDLWLGEISRVQKTNFPHEVTATGRIALSTKNNLGHGISFVFDTVNSALAIQFDTRTVSPSRLVAYLQSFGAESVWKEAVLRKDLIGKLDKYKTRKIEVAVAAPKSFSDLPDEEIGSSLNSLAKAYGGTKIRIIIAADRGETLNSKALNVVKNCLTLKRHALLRLRQINRTIMKTMSST